MKKDPLIRLKSDKFEWNFRYDVYLRLTPSDKYTDIAQYELNIYNSYKEKIKTEIIFFNQKTTIRWENHLLFEDILIQDWNFVDIVVKNHNWKGEFLAVDAFIFEAREEYIIQERIKKDIDKIFYKNSEIISNNDKIKIKKLEKLPYWIYKEKNVICKEKEKKESFYWINFCIDEKIEIFWAIEWCWNNFSDLESSICFLSIDNKKNLNILKTKGNIFYFNLKEDFKFYYFENILFISWKNENFMIIFS